MAFRSVSLAEVAHLSNSIRIWLVSAAEDDPEILGAEAALVDRTTGMLRDREAADSIRVVTGGGGAGHACPGLRIDETPRLVETHAIHEELARLAKATTTTLADGFAHRLADALLHVFRNGGVEKRDGGTTCLAQGWGTILE